VTERWAGHVGSDLAADVAEELRRIARWPVSAFRRARVWLTMYACLLASLRRTGRMFVVARHDGADRLSDGAKVAVFAHHDPAGLVDDSVIYYLGALRSAGYTVVFVSNAPNLGTASLQLVLPLSALVLVRLNVGYDFGAFKDGIEALGELSRFEQVVLANDSVYGPLFDLGKILARCDDSADIWGMTENGAGGYHLQSYFLLFRKPALIHPTLNAFFGSVRPVQSKQWVIQRYEIGLTRAMRRVGLRCAALFPYEMAAAVFAAQVRDGELTRQAGLSASNRRYFAQMMRRLARGRPMNPMHWFWVELVSKMRCPFIKRELLIYNPFGVLHVDGWRNIVRSVSTYDTELAARHMRACQRRSGRIDNAIEERHPTGRAAMTCQRPIHE
jgi:lipopolysaccharide biosynthesis protein